MMVQFVPMTVGTQSQCNCICHSLFNNDTVNNKHSRYKYDNISVNLQICKYKKHYQRSLHYLFLGILSRNIGHFTCELVLGGRISVFTLNNLFYTGWGIYELFVCHAIIIGY